MAKSGGRASPLARGVAQAAGSAGNARRLVCGPANLMEGLESPRRRRSLRQRHRKNGARFATARREAATAEPVRSGDRPKVEGSPGQIPHAPSVLPGPNGFAEQLRSHWDVVEGFLFWLWLGGALVCAIVTGRRIARFDTVLKETLPASERLQRLAREIAVNFRIRHLPDVHSIEWIDVPLLWCAGRCPTIVLPVRVIAEFAEEQSAMILAHEMAHLRRHDHWVRAVELIVSTVYWGIRSSG